MRDAVVNCFLQHGRLIERDALVEIMRTPEPLETARSVLVSLEKDELFVTSDLVMRFIQAHSEITTMTSNPGMPNGQLKVIKAPTCFGETSGKIEEFIDLFRDRYKRLSCLLRQRSEMSGSTPITGLPENGPVKVIGMVSNVINSRRGNRIATIEDETGEVPVLINRVDINLVNDEVVGIEGKVFSRRAGDRMVAADNIIRPQLERRRPNTSAEKVEIAVLSDLHVGSNNFLYDEWSAFMDYLNGKGPYSHVPHNISYILVAGDVVDGIGIYPGQQEDLEIDDIHEQYRELAKLLEPIPDDIKVVLQVGNHDIVRITEPQPQLPDEITSLFAKNVMFLPNPAWLDICGVRVLMYHGRSIDDFVTSYPQVTYQNPIDAMKLMLDMRHLSPIYGGKTPMSPGDEDFMVIDMTPDVFITGHVHSWGVEKYRGTTMINGSTWQSQTDFQRLMNFNPLPARVTVLDLSKMSARLIPFMDVGS